MKKTASAIMSLLILFSSLTAITAFAEDALLDPNKTYTSADGRYLYTAAKYRSFSWPYTDTTKVTLLKYIGKKPLPSKYTVPSSIDGFEVKVVGAKAFTGSRFTEVTFPSTVTAINKEAFKNSKCLRRITISSVSYVGIEAFSGCSSLSKISGEIGSEVRQKAFYNCTSLKKLKINSQALIKEKGVGFYYSAKTKTDRKVGNLKLYIDGTYTHAYSNAATYAAGHGFEIVNNIGVGEDDGYIGVKYHYNVGSMIRFRVMNEYAVSYKSSDTNVARFDKKGRLLCLRSGDIKLSLRTESGKKYRINMRSGKAYGSGFPDVIINNEWYHGKRTRPYEIKLGKSVSCKVYGKVPNIPLSCKSTTTARFVGSKNSASLKIKGLKKGATTLLIRINGVKQIKINISVI